VQQTFLLLATALLLSLPVAAQPREILIIRHAEKPDTGNSPHLTPRGYSRASALVGLFAASYDTPDYVFATQASKQSNRPVETLTPFVAALHMELNSSIADDDFATLAQQILSDPQYAGKMLIICWHHGNIPALAHALGASDAPKTWPDPVFDRVWRIRYNNSGTTFENLPQRLLFGDSQD